jgi:8-oxo-dGTP pyrophosphatase MutT (NUDIX family)
MSRIIRTSVTNFLHYKDKYLFILRKKVKKVDAGRLNGIGGKVEPHEDFLATAIRETQEETGLSPKMKDIHFAGLARTEGGYPEDWIMAFFKIEVDSYQLPIGDECKEGKFLWMSVDEALNSDYELVDDLYYLLPKIDQNQTIFFANAQVNNQEKIKSINITEMPFSNFLD